jgi:hypothetical protein
MLPYRENRGFGGGTPSKALSPDEPPEAMRRGEIAETFDAICIMRSLKTFMSLFYDNDARNC